MNIFFLSKFVIECAKYHCDKHVIKMILETTQLLWSAWHITGPNSWQDMVPSNCKIYRLTHRNHPMSIWVRKSKENYWWLVWLGLELCKEYDNRYRCKCSKPRIYKCNKCSSKTHACFNSIYWMSFNTPLCNDNTEYSVNTTLVKYNIPERCTPVPLCMPEEYHDSDLIQAYKNYYKGDKRYFATWISTKPEWF